MRKFLLICVMVLVVFGTFPAVGADPICPPQTGFDAVLIPNPNDCQEYFECDNGVPRPVCCPQGLYFCPEKGLCAWPWDSECVFDCAMGDGSFCNTCPSGKYGITSSGDSGDCHYCPNGGYSSMGNNETIEDCYIPSGSTGGNASGSFTYTSNCHYQ